MFILIMIPLGVVLGILSIFVPAIRTALTVWGVTALQGILIMFIRFLIFLRDDVWVAFRRMLIAAQVAAIMLLLAFLGMIYGWYVGSDKVVFYFAIGLGLFGTAMFILWNGARHFFNSTTRFGPFAGLYARLGLTPTNFQVPYFLGCLSMWLNLIAMIALGLPNWFNGTMGTLLALIHILAIILWMSGQVVDSTTKWAPTVLSAGAILVTAAYVMQLGMHHVGQQRWLFAKIAEYNTSANRASVAPETASRLSYVEVVEKAYLYTGDVKDGVLTNPKKVTVIDAEGNKVPRIAPVGAKFKAWEAAALLTEAKEPLLAVEDVDELGESIMNTPDNIRYIVSRKVVVSGPVIKERPEIVEAKYDNDTDDNTHVGSKSDQLLAAARTLNSGITAKKGQLVRITADGTASAATSTEDGAYKFVGPDGWGVDPSFNQGRKGPLPRGASFMALAARVSNHEPSVCDGKWIKVGSNGEFRATQDGTIYLTINDPVVDEYGVAHELWRSDNPGGFNIKKIEVL